MSAGRGTAGPSMNTTSMTSTKGCATLPSSPPPRSLRSGTSSPATSPSPQPAATSSRSTSRGASPAPARARARPPGSSPTGGILGACASSTARPGPAGWAASWSPRAARRSRAWTRKPWSNSVERARQGLDIWFCLDTLEYLRRGGRIGAAQALVGSALKIKPILTFGTEISPVGRARTRQRARERMVGYLRELKDRGATDWIVQHAQSPGDAEQLVAEGRAIFGSEPLFCTAGRAGARRPPRLRDAGRRHGLRPALVAASHPLQ